MNADAILADYSLAQPLEGSAIDILRDAMLSPLSEQLRRIMHCAWESGKRDYYRTDEFEASILKELPSTTRYIVRRRSNAW